MIKHYKKIISVALMLVIIISSFSFDVSALGNRGPIIHKGLSNSDEITITKDSSMGNYLQYEIITADYTSGNASSYKHKKGTSPTYQISQESYYYSLVELLVDGVSVGKPETYTFDNVQNNHSIYAVVKKKPIHEITYTVSNCEDPTGCVTVRVNSSHEKENNIFRYIEGQSTTFTFGILNYDYEIQDIKIDGVSKGEIYNYTFDNITSNHNIEITVYKKPKYTINITHNDGGVIYEENGGDQLSYSIDEDGYLYFYIEPLTGYYINEVVENGVSIKPIPDAIEFYGANKTNKTVNVKFALVGQLLITNEVVSGKGIITSNSGVNGSHIRGTDATYTFTPDIGYEVEDVLIDNVSQGNITSYTFTNIQNNHNIKVKFKVKEQLSVTVIQSGPGSVSYKGSSTFENPIKIIPNEDIKLSFTPQLDSSIEDVILNGVSIGNINEYTFSNVSQNQTIEVKFKTNSKFNVETRVIGNGFVFPFGTTSHNASSDVLINATPAKGWSIKDISISYIENGKWTTSISVPPLQNYTIKAIKASHIVLVEFIKDELTINVTSNTGGEVISDDGTNKVSYGGRKTFVFTPDINHEIDYVVVDGVTIGNPSTYTFDNVRKDYNLKVAFKPKPHEIYASIISGNGTITSLGSRRYNTGDTMYYKISPSDGNVIEDVLVDGLSVGILDKYEFYKIDSNHTIEVKFKPFILGSGQHVITASSGAGGSFVPTGPIAYNTGDSAEYKLIVGSDHKVENVIVDGVSLGPITSYTFNDIKSDHSISATFICVCPPLVRDWDYFITTNVYGNGKISPNGVTYYKKDETPSFTLTPDTGWILNEVKVDGKDVTVVNNKYTFSPLNADHHIEAKFVAESEFNKLVKVDSIAPNGLFISPYGRKYFKKGESVTYTISEAGAQLYDVVVDGVSKGKINSYTFTDLQSDHVIEALRITDGSSYPSSPNIPSGSTLSISASSNISGGLSPYGTVEVTKGSSKRIWIDNYVKGYDLIDVFVNGRSIGIVDFYEFNNIYTNQTINAVYKEKPKDHIIVAATNGGGFISPPDTKMYSKGDNATYRITPYSGGYYISQILVDGVSVPVTNPNTTNEYTFTNIDKNHQIIALFDLNCPGQKYTINSIAHEGGTISPNGLSYYEEGSSASYTITPESGYVIDELKVDNNLVTSTNDYKFENINANHKIEVTFKKDPHISKYTIISSSDVGGVITPLGTSEYEANSDARYTMSVLEGYDFLDVIVNGNSIGTPSFYDFNKIQKNHTIHMVVKPKEFTIQSGSTQGGTISPLGIVKATYKAKQDYVMTPEPGFEIEDVLVDGVSVGKVENYSFTDIIDDHTIFVSYKQIPVEEFTIIASSDAGGTINPLGTIKVTKGSNQNFIMEPELGYEVDKVFVDDISMGSINSYDFNNVSKNHTIHVTFKRNNIAVTKFNITSSTDVGGSISPLGPNEYDQGSDARFDISALEGYDITDIKVDGLSTNLTDRYEFLNIQANHTIHVYTKVKEYTVKSSAGTGGTINPLGNSIVKYKSDLGFNISVEPGYEIDDVLVDGLSVGKINKYTFLSIVDNHTIHVNFKKKAVPVNPGCPYTPVNPQAPTRTYEVPTTSSDVNLILYALLLLVSLKFIHVLYKKQN